MKQRYYKKPIICDKNDVNYLTQIGFDEECAEVLCSRGINENNANEFFDANFCFFDDPLKMTNMAKAVDIISQAISNHKSILIYGDYDADGLTASAILKLFFDHNGVDCRIEIPSRDEGYGLHFLNVKNRYEQKPFDLLITVDCGISNVEEIAEIKSKLGVSVVVTDHHELPDELPDCVCINCKMGYSFNSLSGAGVALKLVEALADRQTALLYADLAAVGTIADMMPLSGENRSIVRYGIANMRHRGLKKLAELTKCDFPMTASTVALRICPKINSAGRVGNPYKALDLLLMEDRATTEAVEVLLDSNISRQEMLAEVLSQADAQIKLIDLSKTKMLFLYGKKWAHGILGIAANRYKDEYCMPCAFLTEDGENYIGSARGVGDINMFELFNSVSQYLVRFGGHKGSVGFTVKKCDFDALVQCINNSPLLADANSGVKLYYDLNFNERWLDKDYLSKLECLEPMLPNDKLVFFAKDYCRNVSVFGGNHLRISLGSGLELKAFNNFKDYYRALKSNAECNFLFSLENDKYMDKVVGTVIDMELSNSLNFDELYALNYLNRISTEDVQKTFVDDNQVNSLLKGHSVAVIFNDYLSLEKASQHFDFLDFYLDFFHKKNYTDKQILISPDDDTLFDNYKNVVVFCRDTDDTNLKYGKNSAYAQFLLPTPSFLSKIYLDRQICAEVFKLIRTQNQTFNALELYESTICKVSQLQYFAALKVFEQLGWLKKINNKYILDNQNKNELSNSILFKRLNKNNKL